MPSPRIWLRNWINNALYDEEGWPHDPVNLGISLGLMYLGLPVGLLVALVLVLTGWSDSIPIWMSESLVIYAFFAAWIALDEWRSRKRSGDGPGHGWIIQALRIVWPRRWINRVALSTVGLAFLVGSCVAYVDRFVASDLQRSRYTTLAELILTLPVDIWAIAVAVRLGFASSSSLPFRIWSSLLRALLAIVVVNALITVGDTWRIQSFVPAYLLLILILIGIAVEWIVGKFRGPAPPVRSEGELAQAPSNWW